MPRGVALATAAVGTTAAAPWPKPIGRDISATPEQPAVEVGRGSSLDGIFAAAPDALMVMDAEGTLRDLNPAAERLFGYSRDAAVGAELAQLIVPGPLRQAHRNGLQRYLSTGQPVMLDERIELPALRADGTQLIVELTVVSFDGPSGPMFAGFVRDLTARDTASDGSRLQQRMAFLAQAGLVLDRSLDYNETLGRLAELTVPELAQLTVIDLLDDDGLVRTAVAAAPEPDHARAVETMRRDHPLASSSAHPVAVVLRSQQPVLLPEMSPAFQRAIAAGNEHFALMRRLRYYSAIVVPLLARRRALGTLSLLRLEGSPPYDHDDLVLAEELARRAALAIENSRLFEATRHVARTLQSSLLPSSLPTVPGAELVGRHRAAAEGQEVGGDFYDAFPIDDGRWGVAIGDVCGKGPEAAALTALARYTIRAVAEHAPDEVLRRLNAAVLRDTDRGYERFLTAVFATATRTDDGLALTLAAGGHPPPLVRRADGTTELIEVTGPLIGVADDAVFVPITLTLGPGDTLVLYTDGLTDAEAPARMLSSEDLLELLARGRGLDAQQLVDWLEETAVATAEPRDDVAMLVLAVTA